MPTLVACQRGHVPRTTGSTGTAGEQDLNRAVASEMVAMVAATGWTLRVIDADEPSERYRGDAFVALHADGSIYPSASGASVGYQTAEGRDLGQTWKRAHVQAGWPGKWRPDNYTRGLARYYGVRRAVEAGNRRAIIIEAGFLTNPQDRAWLQANSRRIAAGVLSAVTAIPVGRLLQEDDDMIRPGATGPTVKFWQVALRDAGHDPGPADGRYGPSTQAAVRAFQESYGVGNDGVLDASTLALLAARARVSGGSHTHPSGGDAIRPGDTVRIVRP